MMIKNNSSSALSTLLFIVLLHLNLNISVAVEPVQDTERFPSFFKFMEKFEKHYRSEEELLKRQEIYAFNVEQIKNSNCSSCGVNFYTDWTSSEMSSLRTVQTSEIKEKIGATARIKSNLNERILTETIPQSFDWRNVSKITPVKNQGYCGASWAFSTVAFFEQVAIMAGIANQTINLSESYLISCNPESQFCSAGYIESSIDRVIDRGGIPTQNLYPFNPDLSVAYGACLETNLFKIPNVSRISYYQTYDPQAIKRIILKRPVIAAVCGVDFTFHFPPSNFTPERTLKCKPQNRIIDHSVLLVGYTETEWIVKNHWGKNWGLDGYAYISRNPAEDCCIGEQLHSSGVITDNCSVQYCQTCVETDSCYRCTSGRWVKHNLTTGVQTCELCTEANCSECYNYRGTCKICIDGYALNKTSGKCIVSTVANCNLLSSATTCSSCKKGYRYNGARTVCNPYCNVKNCNKCVQDENNCTECKPGFRLAYPVINGKTTTYCLLNNCSVANCSLCNSTGQCVVCLSSFTLQTNGSCTTNCTAISGCVSCLSGSTTCNECVEGKSYNSSKKVCEVFSGTTNCKIHKTTCTTCRTGYYLNTAKQCMQNCDLASCLVCVKTDPTLCLTCANGYYLTNITANGTTYAGICVANPCNITNCSLCGPNGVGCVSCATKYLVYNATSNKCENGCTMSNCRDCLTITTCDFCNPGYCSDYYTGVCVPCNITNCLQSYMYYSVQYCWTCMNNYYSDYDELNCFIFCTDYWCQECQESSLYICEKCFDGYYMLLVNGSLTCTYVIPTMKGCDFISYNQTYCYNCATYYQRNNATGICQLNTKNCPNYCQYCSNVNTSSFSCKCINGVFEYYSEKCITSPFNDTSCFVVQLFIGVYYCMECLNGKIVNLNQNGCDPACILPNCTLCEQGYNNFCQICAEGFYLNSLGKCNQCPFDNCKTCSGELKCLECKSGYVLDPNQRNCSPMVCPSGFMSDGFECTCPAGTYYTPLSCVRCGDSRCKECSASRCFQCESSYYMSNEFKCLQCLTNCKQCSSGLSCDVCANDYIFDTETSQCINPNVQGGAYYKNGTAVIQCPQNCLLCDSQGKCTQCSVGFATIGGICLNCQNLCKTCQTSNASACTSCEGGYFLNQTQCIKCSDINCLTCSNSASFCSQCRTGFYLQNSTCKACPGQSCLACNFNGECTKCASGYVLVSNNTCQQCVGNCKICNASAISQCLDSCNSTQYQMNGTCFACPSKCTACISSQACSSCVSGYVLRNGTCKPVCSHGCYECQDVNSDVCTQCLVGYVLSQVGTCEGDISCNQNQTCYTCPTGWTPVNKTCEICATEGNCQQCAMGNVNVCGQCKDGYFLVNSSCIACDPTCLKCSSLTRCQLCKDGFLIPLGQFFGSCVPCDSACLTCQELPTKCITCKDGFELSINQACLRVQKIDGQIELDLTMADFPGVSNSIRDNLIQMMGVSAENGTKYYTITNLTEGSVILEFSLAIPDDKDVDTTYNQFKAQLQNSTEVGGVALISVKKVDLIKPVNNNNSNNVPQNPQNPQAASSSVSPQTVNKLAIILGVVIPSVLIILGVIAFTFRRKIFRSNHGIDNFPDDNVKPNPSDVLIQIRPNKLPPLNSVNSSFNNLKELQKNEISMTRQNNTYFNSTGLPHEYSYSKLDGPHHDTSRVNQFDHTLNNIVAQLNEGYKNGLNVIAEGDKISDFNEDISEIKGSQKCILEKEQIYPDIHNDILDDIQFQDNTLRNLNEKQEQPPEGTKLPTKTNEKAHLQIIQFENDQKQDI